MDSSFRLKMRCRAGVHPVEPARDVAVDAPPSRRTIRKDRRRAKLRARDGDACFYCARTMTFDPPPTANGRQWNSGLRATIEHLLDRQHGGTNRDDNLALACRQCNCCRNIMSLAEKLASRKGAQ